MVTNNFLSNIDEEMGKEWRVLYKNEEIIIGSADN